MDCDLYSHLGSDKPADFKASLVPLLDRMLSDSGISDASKLQKIAQLRARIQIELKDF